MAGFQIAHKYVQGGNQVAQDLVLSGKNYSPLLQREARMDGAVIKQEERRKIEQVVSELHARALRRADAHPRLSLRVMWATVRAALAQELGENPALTPCGPV